MDRGFFIGPMRLDSRIATVVAALFILPAMFLPIWRVTLVAPQYPEGLRMFIHAFTVRGDLSKINILNHYVGMKPISPAEFPEFRFIPFFVLRFTLLALVAAVVSRKEIGALGWADFIIFGAAMLADFYFWLYDYGHNLDPRAAMRLEPFTPPLLGSKKLMNFRVISTPDVGAILMIFAGALGPLVLLWDHYRSRKEAPSGKAPS